MPHCDSVGHEIVDGHCVRTIHAEAEVTRNGTDYMGPDVRVNARDSEHAKEIVQQNGHKVNHYFEPTEIKKR